MQYLALITAMVFLGLWISWVNRKLNEIHRTIRAIKGGMILKSLEDAAGED